MFLSSRTSKLVVCAAGLCILGFAGLPGARGQVTAQNDGSDLSSPPQIDPAYAHRGPRKCKSLTTPPNKAQAMVLVQCTMEQETPAGMTLEQDIKLEIGLPRKYDKTWDWNLKEVDPGTQIYPLTGSVKEYWCSPISAMTPAGQGCKVSPIPQALGKCWLTTFGDWKCNLTGFPPAPRTGLPGPTTY